MMDEEDVFVRAAVEQEDKKKGSFKRFLKPTVAVLILGLLVFQIWAISMVGSTTTVPTTPIDSAVPETADPVLAALETDTTAEDDVIMDTVQLKAHQSRRKGRRH